MNLIYLFRKKNTGFSMEILFERLYQEISTSYAIQRAYVPHMRLTPGNIVRNLRFVRQLSASVYHITGDVHYLALITPPARTVLTIHDCVSLDRHWRAGNPIRFLFLWLFFYYLPMKRARALTTISEKTKDELRHYVGPRLAAKVQVIPNFYDPCFQFSPKEFNSARPVILQIGTAPHKNLHRLIPALAGICCQLHIVGPLSPDLHDLLQQHQVSYTQCERLSQAALVQKYQACDLVTFVSTYEGFGLPILEANAVSRAVLTSDLAPMRDIAGSAAHLVNPFQVADIRAGVLRLIEDHPYRQSLIQRGCCNIGRFQLKQIAAEYRDLYQKISQN